MSSGAENLITSPGDTVFEIVVSLISSTIFAIPKSQISGSPLPACDQSTFRGSDMSAEFTSWETRTFFYAPSVNGLSRGYEKLTHLTVEEVNRARL